MTLPTNEERAEWVMQSVDLFATTTGLSIEDEFDVAVADLLANIMHLCAEKGVVFDDVLQTARNNFEAEIEEEEAIQKP